VNRNVGSEFVSSARLLFLLTAIAQSLSRAFTYPSSFLPFPKARWFLGGGFFFPVLLGAFTFLTVFFST